MRSKPWAGTLATTTAGFTLPRSHPQAAPDLENRLLNATLLRCLASSAGATETSGAQTRALLTRY